MPARRPRQTDAHVGNPCTGNPAHPPILRPPSPPAVPVQAADDAREPTASIDAMLHRELYFFTLYRAFEAALLAFAIFSPFAGRLVELRYPGAAQAIASFYMAAALLLLLAMRRPTLSVPLLAALGLALDIAIALIVKQITVGGDAMIAMLLLVNVGAGALLLPLRYAAGLTLAASLGTIGEYVIAAFRYSASQRDAVEAVMFGITYLATATLTHLVGQQLRSSAALADRRGREVANLAHLNELIIRRMRTGVLVVDGDNQVRLMNEAAWHLLGGPRPDQRDLPTLSPVLAQRLQRWRLDRMQNAEPVALAEDRQPVIPRIATLTVIDELFMVFLDDSTLVSRRAEELTLGTLGRLSAGIAHEVRNPLSAIKHSAQLLQESPDLGEMDQRLVEIVLTHCNRMNDIVENVLGLARRERSQPEQVELGQWMQTFVDEFHGTHFVEGHELHAVPAAQPVVAMVDPQQLHQVISALIHNAIAYGHLPGEPARITLAVRQASSSAAPIIEVIDRGPGIPPAVASQIFEPFYTSSELGSGLGLYIARQLCEANQALLEYVPVPAGGACFRISLARPVPLVGGGNRPTATHRPAG
jgi:two-component system, NtrC family, sensor histidine kinase PilS